MEERVNATVGGQGERRTVARSGELHRALDDRHEHVLDVEALRQLQADVDERPQ
jgi:hypothetical protein